MKIKEETIKKTTIELGPEDLHLFFYMLNYSYHRAKKHKTPMTAYLPTIQAWREKLGIIPVKLKR